MQQGNPLSRQRPRGRLRAHLLLRHSSPPWAGVVAAEEVGAFRPLREPGVGQVAVLRVVQAVAVMGQVEGLMGQVQVETAIRRRCWQQWPMCSGARWQLSLLLLVSLACSEVWG